ncbi:hypothetical protein [Noviherbaspirillum sp. ST9]|uniref:hypothetical protein n=1 Tax=Noviherbaspirillum sp. ST9 TaxID=3401606 RepID=UPI003B587343
MKMPAKKNKAVMLAAAVALAGCGKSDKPVAGAATAEMVHVAAADDIDAQLPTVVERRHFAIYNTYRELSEDASAPRKSTATVSEESGLRAVAALDRDFSTCSIHTLPPQD